MSVVRSPRPASAFPSLILPFFLLLFTLLLAASPAAGQEGEAAEPAETEAAAPVEGSTPNTRRLAPGAERPEAKVGQVAWMAGHWRGPAFGGMSEEFWTEPAGGAMLGLFRSLDAEGNVRFYELFTLAEDDDGSLTIRLKHFNPDMTGWEDKDEMVTFPLVAISDDTAWFSGLTFRRAGPDEMHVHLALRSKDGSVREETFRYTRVE